MRSLLIAATDVGVLLLLLLLLLSFFLFSSPFFSCRRAAFETINLINDRGASQFSGGRYARGKSVIDLHLLR